MIGQEKIKVYRFPKPCLRCGKLSDYRLCELHRKEEKERHEAYRATRKRATNQYGGTYARRAKEVRENAIVCHICGEGKKENDPFEADHLNPSEDGNNAILLPAHRSCNRRKGNRPNSTPIAGTDTPRTGIPGTGNFLGK